MELEADKSGHMWHRILDELFVALMLQFSEMVMHGFRSGSSDGARFFPDRRILQTTLLLDTMSAAICTARCEGFPSSTQLIWETSSEICLPLKRLR